MAADTTKFLQWFIVFIFFCLHVSLAHSNNSSQLGRNVHPSSIKEIRRNRRQVCVDGTYEHEGRTCCLCAAGQYLVKHCSTTQDDGKCEQCQRGTYNSHPNSQEACLPCNPCSHPNANVEVAEECTISRDTKCQCKKDHFCNSNTGICKICHPCKECGSDGVKEACTATSDTVCNETPAINTTGAIIGGVVAVVAVVVIAVLLYFLWRKRKTGTRELASGQKNGSAPDVEMQPLKVPNLDLQRLLPDIANELGWKDMEHLAMRSGITNTVIESCKLDHQGDSQEQTLQLLKNWVEMHGRDASTKLIKSLQESGKKAKVERIQDMLSRAVK